MQTWTDTTAGNTYPCLACNATGIVWDDVQLEKCVKTAQQFVESSQQFLDELQKYQAWYERNCAKGG
jgi:hypothetical protein